VSNFPWLPELILRLPGETIDAYIDRVYPTFVADFIQYRPKFRGVELKLRKYMIDGLMHPSGKEATLWHLTSEGQTEENRSPDIARCERIGWVRAILDRLESGDPDIRVWQQQRSGKTNYGLSLSTFEYVVFLGERKGTVGAYTLPLTAYVVEREKRRLHYEAEWKQGKI
jgi:hypothetical protein